MIKWREGKAGFVGAAKRLIKGVFSYSYTLTSVIVGPVHTLAPKIRTDITAAENRIDITESENRIDFT